MLIGIIQITNQLTRVWVSLITRQKFIALLLIIRLARFGAIDFYPWVETQGYRCLIPTGLVVDVHHSQLAFLCLFCGYSLCALCGEKVWPHIIKLRTHSLVARPLIQRVC